MVHIYEKDDKTDCGNHRRISLLPTTNKIVSILLSQVDRIIGDHHCGF
jgi:hypothetical protein